MAASAELLQTLAPFPKQGHEPADLTGVWGHTPGPDGSCACGCGDAPLTSEAPLADAAPLTSEPPLAPELPLTSEPAGAGYGTEYADI